MPKIHKIPKNLKGGITLTDNIEKLSLFTLDA